MSIEETDAGRKAARGRQAAVGRFLAIINHNTESEIYLETGPGQPEAGDEVEITCDAQGQSTQPWRPLIDIIPPTPTRH